MTYGFKYDKNVSQYGYLVVLFGKLVEYQNGFPCSNEHRIVLHIIKSWLPNPPPNSHVIDIFNTYDFLN